MQDVSQDAGGCISVPRAVTSLLMAFRNSTAHQGCPPPRHKARYLNTILATMHGGGLQKGGHAHFKLGRGGRESEAQGTAAPNWPRKHPVSFLQLQDSAIKAASDSALIHIFAFFFSVVCSSNKATCTLLPHDLFPCSCTRAQVLLPPTSPSSSAAWHLFLLRAGLRTPSLTPSLSYVHFRMKLMRYQCWWQAVPGFSNADIVFIHSQPSSSTSTLQLSRSNFSNKWECFLKKT